MMNEMSEQFLPCYINSRSSEREKHPDHQMNVSGICDEQKLQRREVSKNMRRVHEMKRSKCKPTKKVKKNLPIEIDSTNSRAVIHGITRSDDIF